MGDKSGNSDGEVPVVVESEPERVSAFATAQPNLSTSITQMVKTPKQVYYEKIAEVVMDETVKANLKELFEMGFTNFEVNSGMLAKYENNLGTVSNLLCEQALSESCISAIYK